MNSSQSNDFEIGQRSKKKRWKMLWARDLASSFLQWRLILAMAVDDLRVRYHRTLLGPLWIVTTFVVFIAVKIFIFSALAETSWRYFAAYLTLGYLVWTFLSSAFIDGANSFIQSRNWILGTKCNYTVFVLQALVRSLLVTFITGISAILIAYFLYPFPLENLISSFLGMMAIIVMTFWVQLFLATGSVFARDLIPLVQTAMRILFFLTPIIWVPQSLGARAYIAEFNPFTHILSVVRNPLLEEPVTTLSWIVVVSISLTCCMASLLLFAWGRTRIPSHI
jgi:ABC-type polysaccharide/polyol phosphate export permease